ncbi:MAG TPA: response regulator [Bacteriovoracaceae bacterium]|nr:response regulator [Bacteriovoracaceae bacterium]
MFVDDEFDITEIATLFLQDMGYEVEVHLNPTEALTKFKSSPTNYLAVFTDLSMPFMRGDLFATEIHKLNASVPIVLCTGNSFSEEETERLKKNGVSFIVPKPYGPSELENVIKAILK